MRKITLSLFVILSSFYRLLKPTAQSSAVPVVNTYKDATSTSVIINLPDGFNGSVMTTYDGNQIKTTYSTSTPMTNDQINKVKLTFKLKKKLWMTYSKPSKKCSNRCGAIWVGIGKS